MVLQKLTENLAIHQSLPDAPTLTPQELKIKWDEASEKIKTYINNTLIPAIINGSSEDLEKVQEEIEENVNKIVDDFKKEVEDNINNINNEIESKLSSLKEDIEKDLNTAINGATEIIHGTPTMQGSASASWYTLFRVGNVVHVFVEGTCNISTGADEIILTMPLGFIAEGVRKISGTLSKNDFDWTQAVEISNGVCKINGGTTGVTKFVISGFYNL